MTTPQEVRALAETLTKVRDYDTRGDSIQELFDNYSAAGLYDSLPSMLTEYAALLERQAQPTGWLMSGHGYAPVFVEQAEPPSPLTRDEAIALGWRPLYAAPQPDEIAAAAAGARERCARTPLTRQQIDDVMTQHYPLSSLLREEVDAFEACVRDIERLHGIGA